MGGELYGTTYSGGASGVCGTVYEVSTSGAERLIHSFSGSGGKNGCGPQAELVAVGSELYGTTCCGGNGVGDVFEVSTSGKERELYSFPFSGKRGADPFANLIDVGGELYSTTTSGGKAGLANGLGTVFEVSASGKESVLHSFGKGGDGEGPVAGLIAVGSELYGTTESGGDRPDGTVYEISTTGTERVLYKFKDSPDGSQPEDLGCSP